ncbi:MAG: AAA family ATPase [Planctomycetes bacterium]|nr:AAA family ATPase [Planctomycetota bacterium]
MSAEALLAELRDPACYPHAPAAVQLVQTHLSVVCLAGDLVYKLKKARRLPFVDFSTLAARRATCRDEVRLNRRLCADVYLGTAALRRDAGGALRFAAIGDDDGPDDLDTAVVMRRLPADRMLDRLVHERRATTAEIERLARHLAAFHAGADRGPAVLAAGDPLRLQGFAAANFRELAAVPDHGLPAALLQRVAAASAEDFARLLPLLQRRAAAGRVVDGHGDLHARNVCLVEPPVVYDCIEFEPAFRCGDVATENAFLVMDLRHRHAPDLAAVWTAAYVAASGDTEQPALLPPLVAYRAMVRAKVAALAAAEPELPADDRAAARRSAHRHLWLAAAASLEARGPRWLVVCGPPASGKSSLCTALVDVAHWPHFATDVVRKQLAGLPPAATAGGEHYTAAASQRTYDELLRRAAAATAAGAPVVLLDGNFPTAALRAAAAAAARAAGARLQVAFVAVDAATAAARAARRTADPDRVSDADAAVTARLHAAFAPPTAGEGLALVQLDGAQPTEALAAHLLGALLA